MNCVSLYMFRSVFPSVVRSPKPKTVYRAASRFVTNAYDIYLKLYVESWTPDDGRRDRPKPVE